MNKPMVMEPGVIAFELERFAVAGDRLEVTGRWLGVRGRRFVRPSLTVAIGDGVIRALAELEHKPWAPEEGEAWIAAFPWSRSVDGIDEFELAVAPDIAVRLPSPEPAGRSSRTAAVDVDVDRLLTAVRPDRDAAGSRLPANPGPRPRSRARDRPAAELQAALAERNDATARRQRAEGERDQVVAARDRLVAELQEAVAASERAVAGRDRAVTERDVAVTERDRAVAERDGAATARDQAVSERDQAVAERDGAAAERDDALAERDGAVAGRHRALAERDDALAARDQAVADRDQAAADRDQAAAAHDRAPAEPQATATLPPIPIVRQFGVGQRFRARALAPRPQIGPRIIALCALIASILILLLIISSK
jgi:hypothetical protein